VEEGHLILFPSQRPCFFLVLAWLGLQVLHGEKESSPLKTVASLVLKGGPFGLPFLFTFQLWL